MKKTMIFAGMLSIGYAYAQRGNVGINTTSPNATLEVKVADANASNDTNQGVLIPKLSKTRVAAIADGKLVKGTLVFVEGITYAGTNAKVVDINADGFYYYNGTKWVKTSTENTVSSNIYTADGVLISNRVVNQDGKWLDFDNGGVTIKGNVGVYHPLTIRSMHSGGNGGIQIEPNAVYEKRVEMNTTPEGNLRFWAGTDLLYGLRNGNVGIGTATPSDKLHIAGNARIGKYDEGKPGSLILEAVTAEEGGHITLSKDRTHGTQDWHIDQVGNENRSRFRIFPGFEQNNGISILENGNMGIGNNAPTQRLDVTGNAKLFHPNQSTILYLDTNDNMWSHLDYRRNGVKRWDIGMTDTQNYFINSFKDNGEYYQTPFFIDRTTGNIAIHNVDPSQALDVAGNIKSRNLSGDGDKIVMANNDGTLVKGVSINNFATSNIYTADGSTNGDRTVNTVNGFLTIKGNVWNPLVIKSEIVPNEPTNNARGGIAVYHDDINKRIEFATTKDGDVRIWANGDRMYVKRETGNVGIGTNAPKAKLQVAGGIRASQGVPAGDDTNLGYAFGTDGDTGLFATADPTNNNISTNLDLYVNNESRLNINQQGEVKIAKLAGTGTRNVVADSTGKLVIGQATTPIRTVTAATTIAATDDNGYVYVNSSSAVNVTIPANLPVGFSCVIVQKGVGQVTIVAGTGATAETARGTKTRARHSAVGIIKDTASTFTITGDAVN